MIQSSRVRVLLVGAVALTSIAAVAVTVWILQKRSGYYASELSAPPPTAALSNKDVKSGPSEVIVPSPSQPSPAQLQPDAPEVIPVASPSPAPSSTPTLSLDPSYVGKLNLIIPVVGVKPEQLLDTFKDARSEGRVHDAIDIPAPAGTPVIASAEGQIIKLFESERGGKTIYQLSKDKKLIFYYAHLQRYADGLAVGKTVWQGETIAYVGDTGNAGAGNYHLHFSTMVTNNPKRYWEGTNINPYPLLRRGK